MIFFTGTDIFGGSGEVGEQTTIKKTPNQKAPNSGTTPILKITPRYLESARIWIYSSILKKGKNIMFTLFEGPH